jgi:hypothetical protein
VNGRYRTWELTVSVKDLPTIRPVDYEYIDALSNFIFDGRYKVLKIQESDYEWDNERELFPICVVIGEMTKRRRASYINNKILEFQKSPTGGYTLDKYFYHYYPASQVYEKAGIGEIFSSSSEVLEYKGNEIRLLDLHNNRHPWQEELLKKFYNEAIEEFVEPDHRRIIWIYDPVGCTGKSKFFKWICVNRPEEVAKLTFGTANQLRSSIISAGPRKCYFLDLPRTISEDDSL